MHERNATAAVIGAGDYIGAAIARKFAAEGFTVCAGRRNGDKLAPLVADVEAQGGQIVARSLDARKEADLTAFLQEADQHAPLEVCIFNIGANANVPRLPSMVSYPVTRWCRTLGQRAFLPLFVSATYHSPFALRIPLRTFSSGHARHGGTHFAPASHSAERDHPKGTAQ